MNYIQNLSAFVKRLETDDRLNPNHVSLYFALFQVWNLNRFRSPVSISREQVLKLSRIGSLHTYYKCLKDLHTWGYIEYHPSKKPVMGSLISFYNLDEHVVPVPVYNNPMKSSNCPELPLFDIENVGEIETPGEFSQEGASHDTEMHPNDTEMHSIDTKMHSIDTKMHPNGTNLHQTSENLAEEFMMQNCTNYDTKLHPIGCKNDICLDAKLQPSINNININNNKTVKGSKQTPFFENSPGEKNVFLEEKISKGLKASKKKRKKVAPKKEKKAEIEMPFSSSEFTENWQTLIQMPKWKNKRTESLKMALKKLSKYEEEFAIHLVELAITNEWQGVVFCDTDAKYKAWKKSKSDNDYENKTINKRSCSPESTVPETIEPVRNYNERF